MTLFVWHWNCDHVVNVILWKNNDLFSLFCHMLLSGGGYQCSVLSQWGSNLQHKRASYTPLRLTYLHGSNSCWGSIWMGQPASAVTTLFRRKGLDTDIGLSVFGKLQNWVYTATPNYLTIWQALLTEYTSPLTSPPPALTGKQMAPTPQK